MPISKFNAQNPGVLNGTQLVPNIPVWTSQRRISGALDLKHAAIRPEQLV